MQLHFICKFSIVVFLSIVAGCSEKNSEPYSGHHYPKEDADGQPFRPDINPDPSPDFLTPEESINTIHLPEGYHLELVASEPMIEDPVDIIWDGNGRMYVAEMRTFMPDVDGTDQDKPISRVSMLEDTTGNGKMDIHSVFIDSLVLPRMLLALDDRIVVNETYSNNYYSYRDTNGDGKANEKVRIHHDDTIDTWNLEHQKSGLVWNIDNYIYITTPDRFHFSNGKMHKESFDDPSWPFGQWGLANDNYGRLFYSHAGGEIPALGFQQNPVYGQLNFDDQYDEDFRTVWPVIGTPDVQGGPLVLREDSTLRYFTANGGQSIYRGDRLPEEMVGDYFIGEPVGRLVRRAKVMNRDGKIYLENAYKKAEFLASTDMNFRPIKTATGPDGYLYIVDMYRGIIQESNWTGEGSFVRPVILRKGLDKNIGKGRIYRVVYGEYKPEKPPQLLDISSIQLVEYLGHPNGWWRDTAQKLIVLRDGQSSVPALQKMVSTHTSHLGRLHALWTLDGLNAMDKEMLFQAYQDEHPQVRKAAVRISEALLKEGDHQTMERLESFKDDPSPDVRIQLALSLRFSQSDQAVVMLNDLLNSYSGNEILVISVLKSLETLSPEIAVAQKNNAFDEADESFIARGATIYNQFCAGCHGSEGKGLSTGGNYKIAPDLTGSKRVNGNNDILIKILLDGLSGPVDGKEYPGIMPPMKMHDDEWIASVLSYIRNALDNDAAVVHPDEVREVRSRTAGRNKYWTLEELDILLEHK